MAGIWDEFVDHKQTAEFCRMLGVEEDADLEDITKAYRQKALKCHPDKNPDDPKATAKFQELGKAYQHLRDLKKKQNGDFQDEEAWEYFDEESDPESFAEFLFFLVLRDLYRNGYRSSGNDEYYFFTRLNKKFRRYRTEDEDFTEEELQRLHCSKDPAPGKKKRGKKKTQPDKPQQYGQNRSKKTKKQLKAEQYRREQEMMKVAEEIEKKNAEELERLKKQKEKEKSASMRCDADKLCSDLSCAETNIGRKSCPSVPKEATVVCIEKSQDDFCSHRDVTDDKDARVSPRDLRRQKKEKKKQEKEAQLKIRQQMTLNTPDTENPKSPRPTDQYMAEHHKEEALSSVIDTDERKAKLEAFKAKYLATRAQKQQEVEPTKQVSAGCSLSNGSKSTEEVDTECLGDSAAKPRHCDKALLEKHMQQYHELMKQQPRRHTQIQLRTERQTESTHTWTKQEQNQGQDSQDSWQELRRSMLQREKERELERNRLEQETLRQDKTSPHEASHHPEGRTDLSVGVGGTEDKSDHVQEMSYVAGGYNSTSLASAEWQEGTRPVCEETGWDDTDWEEGVENKAPTSHPWKNTRPAPPPTVNRWQERLELMSLCPRTEEDEEEMLRKAIQLSQRQAVEDEHRRQVKFEKIVEEQKKKRNNTPTAHQFPSSSAPSRRDEPYSEGAGDFPPLRNGASWTAEQEHSSSLGWIRHSKPGCKEPQSKSCAGMAAQVSEDWESDLTDVEAHPSTVNEVSALRKPFAQERAVKPAVVELSGPPGVTPLAAPPLQSEPASSLFTETLPRPNMQHTIRPSASAEDTSGFCSTTRKAMLPSQSIWDPKPDSLVPMMSSRKAPSDLKVRSMSTERGSVRPMWPRSEQPVKAQVWHVSDLEEKLVSGDFNNSDSADQFGLTSKNVGVTTSNNGANSIAQNTIHHCGDVGRKDSGLSGFQHSVSIYDAAAKTDIQREQAPLSRSVLDSPKQNGEVQERFQDVQKSPPKRHLSGCGNSEDSNKSLKAEARGTLAAQQPFVFPLGATQAHPRDKAAQLPISAPPGLSMPSATPAEQGRVPAGLTEPGIGPLRNPSPPGSESVGISSPLPLMAPFPAAIPPAGVLPTIPPPMFPPFPGYPAYPAYPGFPAMYPYLPVPAMQSPVYMYSLQQVQHGMGKLSSSSSSVEGSSDLSAGGVGEKESQQTTANYSGRTVDPRQAVGTSETSGNPTVEASSDLSGGVEGGRVMSGKIEESQQNPANYSGRTVDPRQAASSSVSSGNPTVSASSCTSTTPHMPSSRLQPSCYNESNGEISDTVQHIAQPIGMNDGTKDKEPETSDKVETLDSGDDLVAYRVTKKTTGQSRWMGSRPSSVRRGPVGCRAESTAVSSDRDSRSEPLKSGGLYSKVRTSFKRAPVAPRFQRLQEQQQQRGSQQGP